MDRFLETPLTRDDIVWSEGEAARKANLDRKASPYRPGSADDVAWQLGYSGEHVIYGRID